MGTNATAPRTVFGASSHVQDVGFALLTPLDTLVLLVVNDLGQPRTYRVDRIAAVRPTDKPFKPKYVVAF